MTPSDWETAHPRKSVNLSPEQWQRLDQIASQLASPTARGPRSGEASWRTLLADIADGRLLVVSSDLYQGDALLRCSDPNCDSRPFPFPRAELLEIGGWLACEHCGQPCIEVQP